MKDLSSRIKLVSRYYVEFKLALWDLMDFDFVSKKGRVKKDGRNKRYRVKEYCVLDSDGESILLFTVVWCAYIRVKHCEWWSLHFGVSPKILVRCFVLIRFLVGA